MGGKVEGYSIELVDEDGRKVRLAITGHWSDLTYDVTQAVIKDLRIARSALALSDYEELS